MTDAEASDQRSDPWVYTLNRGLAQLIPLSFGYLCSTPFSDIFHRLWHSKREAARRNYALMLGRQPDDPLVEHMARRTFRHFGRYIIELCSVQGWSLDIMREHIDIEGDEHFDEARKYGKGVIFTSAHMGSIEVAGTLALVKGFKITSVAERLEPKMLRDWVTACRSKMGVELLPTTGSGMKLVRRLRHGEMVALVVDIGVSGGDGLRVPFFGHETVFPAGPARLARLSGASIVFGWAARKPHGRYLAHVSAPILSNRELAPEEDAMVITRRIVREFESAVRRFPAQWYVFRDMWPSAERSSLSR